MIVGLTIQTNVSGILFMLKRHTRGTRVKTALWCLSASFWCNPQGGSFTSWHRSTKLLTSFFSCILGVKKKKFAVSDTLVYELLVGSIFIFEERNPPWFVGHQVFPCDSVFETALPCLRFPPLILFCYGPEGK